MPVNRRSIASFLATTALMASLLVLLILAFSGCATTYECECTRYKKYMTGASTSITVSKIKEKNAEAARRKCENASDSASTWNREEKLNCRLRQK